MQWKQSGYFNNQCFFEQPGFNVLIEQSRLNVLSFTERLIQARQHKVFRLNTDTSVDNVSLDTLLTQSPFNDNYLLTQWCEYYQLDRQQLALLLSNDWLKQLSDIIPVISADKTTVTVNDCISTVGLDVSALLDEIKFGQLNIFKAQVNEVINKITAKLASNKNAAFTPKKLILVFIPQLLNRLHVISHKAIEHIKQKYPDNKDDEKTLAYCLFNHFPALLRQVNQSIFYWQAYLLEFSVHLANDFEQLQTTFFQGQELGQFQSISAEQGDTHNQGRYVLVCQFSCGKKLVYKPRSLALEQAFYHLLGFIAGASDMPDFYCPTFLVRKHHGWMEYIETLPCKNSGQVAQYYYNAGCLLSVLYLLEAEDIHFENVIARGSSPVIIDLETLFHLRDDNVRSVQGQAVNHSVLKSHFIMQYEAASPEQELAAIFAVSDKSVELQRSSLPSLSGKSIPVNDYGDDFVRGFEVGYQQLFKLKDQLVTQLTNFKGLPARYIARPTRIYHRLWQSSCQPYYQQSMMQLELCYEKLWLDIKKSPDLIKIISGEKEALMQGDIPLLTNIIGEKSISLAGDVICTDYFKQDSFSLVLAKLANFSAQDCTSQLKIIKRSLQLNHTNKASLIKQTLPLKSQGEGHDSGLGHIQQTDNNWLEISQVIGQKIVAEAAISEHSVFWPVYKQDHQGLSCLDATNYSLHDGVSGILLYLAYLNEAKPGSIEPELLTRSAFELLSSLANESFTREGCGAFNGLGGVVYLISHLLSLWQEQEQALREFARVFIAKLATMTAFDRVFDVVAGSAGAILSLLSYESVVQDKQALTVACAFGDHLVASFHDGDSHGRCGWTNRDQESTVLSGFSHGIAGISYALMRLFQLTGNSKYQQIAIKAMVYEQSTYSEKTANWLDFRYDSLQEQEQQAMSAWCNGAMGIGYSRLMLSGLGDAEFETLLMKDIQRAKINTLAHPQLKDHGLCHGHFGNQEFIQQLIQAKQSEETSQQQFVININNYLSAINSEGISRNKDQFELLSLMDGLAGIGYQLLRFTLPEQIPSVLMLQPPLK